MQRMSRIAIWTCITDCDFDMCFMAAFYKIYTFSFGTVCHLSPKFPQLALTFYHFPAHQAFSPSTQAAHGDVFTPTKFLISSSI